MLLLNSIFKVWGEWSSDVTVGKCWRTFMMSFQDFWFTFSYISVEVFGYSLLNTFKLLLSFSQQHLTLAATWHFIDISPSTLKLLCIVKKTQITNFYALFHKNALKRPNEQTKSIYTTTLTMMRIVWLTEGPLLLIFHVQSNIKKPLQREFFLAID